MAWGITHEDWRKIILALTIAENAVDEPININPYS
jgi:hypothetical protein